LVMQPSTANLKSKILNLPKKPGVYRFLDKDGGVIYIGKAKNLRSRVGQYFNGSDERPQIPFLVKEAADFGYTVVNNELESLYLENTLIKQYLPKYNILLRDDKNYAFIKIDYSTEIPQIGYARKIDSDINLKSSILNPKSVFFGPYTAVYKIRNTLHLMRKIFPYCSALKVSGKPCFHYHLHRCPGVCIGKISLDDYRFYLKKIEDFLAGNNGKIMKQLKNEMKLAAAKKLFEKAARVRDQLNALALLEERQSVILAKRVDWDIVSLASSDGYSCVNLFKIRGGKMRDKENFVYEIADPDLRIKSGSADVYGSDVLQKFLEQYYLETSDIPKIIYTQTPTTNAKIVQDIIHARIKSKTEIILPKKGKPAELVKLGVTNAQEYLSKWLSDQAGHLDKINRALQGLKDVLKLADIPRRIECYDISNIQGTNAVGSMVVFKDGLPAKSEYRKFKIRGKTTPDDFAMMKEMLSRRLARSAPNLLGNKTADKSARYTDNWALPDLIVIDGGKGQLNAALEALPKCQISNFKFQIIGLAKRIEEIFLPNNPEPIILSHDDPALQLLQRLRDEAHRFGITFHRQLRSKEAVRSILDDIRGVGPKTKKLLKTKFGTIADIKKASPDELAKVIGVKLAKDVKQNL
jgi:excinuclease ABC subunit C